MFQALINRYNFIDLSYERRKNCEKLLFSSKTKKIIRNFFFSYQQMQKN